MFTTFLLAYGLHDATEWIASAESTPKPEYPTIESLEETNLLNERIIKINQEIQGNYITIGNLEKQMSDLESNIIATQENIVKRNDKNSEIEEEAHLIHMKHHELSKIKDQISILKSQLRIKEQKLEDILSFSERISRVEQVPTETDMPVSKPIEPIKKIITSGSKYIGNSVYVFGGGRTENDIADGRFDCSSFVHWAFKQAGFEIGTTTDTIKNNGRPISTDELQPGDLVFFDTYKKDGHVGIYLGNNKFLGSQSSTGVAIASMASGYWKERFNGRVIRIIE